MFYVLWVHFCKQCMPPIVVFSKAECLTNSYVLSLLMSFSKTSPLSWSIIGRWRGALLLVTVDSKLAAGSILDRDDNREVTVVGNRSQIKPAATFHGNGFLVSMSEAIVWRRLRELRKKRFNDNSCFTASTNCFAKIWSSNVAAVKIWHSPLRPIHKNLCRFAHVASYPSSKNERGHLLKTVWQQILHT